MSQLISSVVIVGGGTAGWLTAGTLAAKFKAEYQKEISVTLVESPNVPIIGVGEGTWPTMRTTLRNMGVRETDFIRECNVSFKQGAKFSKWTTGAEDDFYYHPLVLPEGYHDENLASHWLENNGGVSFSRAVSPQEDICNKGLAPKLITTPEYASVVNYAYHLDAGVFAKFLQRHCVENLGVTHVLADVVGVNAKENGDIASVETKQAGAVSGDLFVDCTGFKSLLLGQHYGVPFKSCKDVLFLDTALAVHVPYESEDSPIASHTISTAQDAGWVWDIGLPSRRGVGHVYSSAHTTQDHAEAQLRTYLKETGVDPEVEFRNIPLEPGHRTKFWEKNCVAVGLSAGFLEPLEASALLLIEISGTMIGDQFPATRSAMDVIAKRYNETFLYRWDRIIDFLKLHYVASSRDDTQFWIDNRDAASIPESLQDLLRLWKDNVPWHDDFDRALEVFPAASYQYILYGMGFSTDVSRLGTSDQRKRSAYEYFEKNQKKSRDMVDKLPENRLLINKIKEFGLQRV